MFTFYKKYVFFEKKTNPFDPYEERNNQKIVPNVYQ